jgi:ribokinase
MALWNLGSINQDLIYSVPHIPAPGETLSSRGFQSFLGGKGVNMSVAAARAGAQVKHIGAVGSDGRWAVDRLTEYGVDTRFIAELETETGQAVVMVAVDGENAILLNPAANHAVPLTGIQAALAEARPGDRAVFQNETNLQPEFAQMARDLGLIVCYAAAPFSAGAVERVLPMLDFLILNQIEADQLLQATGKAPGDLGVRDVIVTLGGDGCDWFGPDGEQHFDAIPVDPVDTTGAGDTFTGYVLAGLEQGMPMAQAIGLATRAGALMVTRSGTADVIPDLSEVRAFGS